MFFVLPDVPVMDEPVEPVAEPVERAGKGEGFTTQIAHALAQGVVGSLDLACFSPRVFVAFEAATVFVGRVLEGACLGTSSQTRADHR